MAYSAPHRLNELEMRVALLQHRIDELLGTELNPPAGLNGAKFRMINLIARQSPMVTTVNSLIHAITEHELDLSRPTNNVKVHMSRARKILTPLGVRIETVHGLGYRMPPDSKAKWQALVDAANSEQEQAA